PSIYIAVLRTFPTRRSSDLAAGQSRVGHVQLARRGRPDSQEIISLVSRQTLRRRTRRRGQRIESEAGWLCLSRRIVSALPQTVEDRKSTRLNSSHQIISYAV